jgi:hypothetical protein
MFAELTNGYVDEGAKWFKRPRFGHGTLKTFLKLRVSGADLIFAAQRNRRPATRMP